MTLTLNMRLLMPFEMIDEQNCLPVKKKKKKVLYGKVKSP